ncbi:SusD/RagB family nutrient-binding outer membrane lipoprotein [Dyadobacter tibetensis]|uniref:SusD/RagB family nutrient-binding outer membrane lipoprotein n=1 Tax=Dyadobacter tibetensis TaxID=1211851 RepID=UPI0004716295|nr:SusD/RagB family nutrient-binding outer membrane lipoprotein [Dyadobacter tibetensis]
MKNHTKKGVWTLLSILALSLGACNDFQEINTDPTRMTNINAASLLTQAIYDAGTRSRGFGDIGNYIGQYWTNTSLIDQRHRYDFKGSDSEEVYDNIYGTLYDLHDLKLRAQNEQLDDYLGAGLVLEAYLTTYLTDVFGPIPYTDAMQGDQLNFTPKFDDQESVYRTNLDKLDQALSLMQVRPTGNFVRGGDAFYMGNMGKWRKLANSLKLRMYMKMVAVDPSVKSKIATLIQEGELILKDDETCAIIYDGRFGLQSTIATGTAESVALAETFAQELHNTLDPRRPFMAALGKDKNGNPVNVDAQGEPIFMGVPSGESPDIIREFSGLAAPYTGLRGVRAPSVLLSRAEVELFIAEAILRGYVDGDAEAHYEAGIRSSCLWWGVDEAGVKTHLAKPSVQLAKDYDAALKQVLREQFINFYYQGYDGWINYKRVKYPVFHVGSAMATDQIMKRMVYPPLIKSINAVNYKQAVQVYLDQGDVLLSGSWWFK